MLRSSSERFAKGDTVLSLPSSYFKALQRAFCNSCIFLQNGKPIALQPRGPRCVAARVVQRGSAWCSLTARQIWRRVLKLVGHCFIQSQVLLTNFPVRGGFSVPRLKGRLSKHQFAQYSSISLSVYLSVYLSIYHISYNVQMDACTPFVRKYSPATSFALTRSRMRVLLCGLLPHTHGQVMRQTGRSQRTVANPWPKNRWLVLGC